MSALAAELTAIDLGDRLLADGGKLREVMDAALELEEWKAVYLVTQRKPPPDEPPTLDTMVRMVAGFGGFLNRKNDGFPGPKTLWIGLQRVPEFVLALDAQRSIGESCG